MGGSGSKEKPAKKSEDKTPARKASVVSNGDKPAANDDDNEGVFGFNVTPDKTKTIPTVPVSVEKSLGSDVKKRLSAQKDTSHLVSALEQKENSRREKMFTSGEAESHSKIYKALNPDKLWFESRREREMAKEDDEDDDIDFKLFMRSGDDFGMRIQDENGNVIGEDEELGEDVVPAVIPTFDPETEAELKQLRQEREKKLRERQDALRAKWLKQKEEEERKRQEEIKRILEEEKKMKKKEEVSDDFVKQAQLRMSESTKEFGEFLWKPE